MSVLLKQGLFIDLLTATGHPKPIGEDYRERHLNLYGLVNRVKCTLCSSRPLGQYQSRCCRAGGVMTAAGALADAGNRGDAKPFGVKGSQPDQMVS
jgi:hypothetical protein